MHTYCRDLGMKCSENDLPAVKDVDVQGCVVLLRKVVGPHLSWLTKLTAASKLEGKRFTRCETCYQYQNPSRIPPERLEPLQVLQPIGSKKKKYSAVVAVLLNISSISCHCRRQHNVRERIQL